MNRRICTAVKQAHHFCLAKLLAVDERIDRFRLQNIAFEQKFMVLSRTIQRFL